MSPISRKLFIPDKTFIILIVLISAALVCAVASFIYTGTYTTGNDSLRKQISSIQEISGDVLVLKKTVELKEKKIKTSKAKGAVSELQRILKTLGMKAAAIKPLDKKKTDRFMEENAELEIQNTDLNSIVNLAYKIENSPAPMKINNASLKTTFEDPDKFILKLTVSLLSR